MIPLFSNLLTSSEDIWLFDTSFSGLRYSLIFGQAEVNNIRRISNNVDRKGRIHLFVLTVSGQAFHVVWDNSIWRKYTFPFSDWDYLLSYFDLDNRLYVCLKDSSGLHFLKTTENLEYTEIKLMMEITNDPPLFFTVDFFNVTVYFFDSIRGALTLYIFSGQNTDIQVRSIRFPDQQYHLLKFWVFRDLLLMILRDGKPHSYFYSWLIDLKSYENMRVRHLLADLSPDESYHLLADGANLLLLVSTAEEICYFNSDDGGRQWTKGRLTTLFSPCVFQDVSLINSCPANLIRLKMLKGCSLRHPLILNYSELVALFTNQC